MRTTATKKSPAKTTEKLVIIERPLRPEWTVCVRNEKGHKEWWLRIECTGLYARRYGPFVTQRQALCYLDDLLDVVDDVLITGPGQTTYQPKRVGLIEDELDGAYLRSNGMQQKGR